MDANPALKEHATKVIIAMLQKSVGTIVITPIGVVTENKLLN